MKYSTILLEKMDAAAWVTLNRPHALNATTEQMHRELLEVMKDVAEDTSVKAMVITGAGERAFCIGSDLQFLKDALVDSFELRLFQEYLERLNRVFFQIEELPVPVIAMVNGKARAGGFEMIMACDLVLIAEDAAIGDVHTPYGHVPGAGGTQRTARKIGIQRTLELLYTGRWLTAAEAVNYGIALKAVPRARLRQETANLISQLTDKNRECLTLVKRAVLQGLDLPLREGIQFEVDKYVEYLSTSPAPIELFRRNIEARKAASSRRS